MPKILIFLFLLIGLYPTAFAQYRFKLPENTGYKSGYSLVNNNQYIRIVNKSNQNSSFIEFYDLNSGKFLKQITINPIKFAESFYLEADNSIWLFDEESGILINMVNGKKKKEIDVIEKIPLPKSGYFPYSGDLKWSPIHYYKNSFYVINNFDRAAQVPIIKTLDKEFIQSVNISTGQVKNNISLPPMFFERDYGALNKFSSCRKDNLIVIAPNFSNEIFIYNLENGNVVYPLTNDNYPHFAAAKPLLTKDKFDISRLSEEEWVTNTMEHYYENSEYINILYDPYKKQYYRTLLIRDPKMRKVVAQKIIVLNNRFNFVKELKLSLDYQPEGMFVSKKGLNILNYKKYKEDRAFLNFDSFNL